MCLQHWRSEERDVWLLTPPLKMTPSAAPLAHTVGVAETPEDCFCLFSTAVVLSLGCTSESHAKLLKAPRLTQHSWPIPSEGKTQALVFFIALLVTPLRTSSLDPGCSECGQWSTALPALGSLLEMQNLKPHPRPVEAESAF